MTGDLPPEGGHTGGGTTAPQKNWDGADDVFARIRHFGAVRPDEGRWVGGVAAGLARRWDIDPLLLRGVFVALSFAGCLGIAAYGILWLLLPQADGRIHLQQAFRGRFSAGFVGAVLMSLTIFGGGGPWGGGPWSWGPPRFLMILLVLGLVFWVVRTNGGGRYQPWGGRPPGPADVPGTPVDDAPDPVVDGPAWGSPVPPPPHGGVTYAPDPAPVVAPPYVPPAPPVDTRPGKGLVRGTLGLALLVAAGVLIVGAAAGPLVAPAGLVAASAALGVIALGVIVAGMRGRRARGLGGLGILLMIAVLIGTGVHHAGVRPGQNTAVLGSYAWHPTSVADAERPYNLGLGENRLLLTNPALLADATADDPLRVSVHLGVGQTDVVTPGGVPVAADVSLGVGQVTDPQDRTTEVHGGNGGPQSRHLTWGGDGKPLIVITVQQGVGEVNFQTTQDAAGLGPTGLPLPAPAVTVAPSAKAAPTPTVIR